MKLLTSSFFLFYLPPFSALLMDLRTIFSLPLHKPSEININEYMYRYNAKLYVPVVSSGCYQDGRHRLVYQIGLCQSVLYIEAYMETIEK